MNKIQHLNFVIYALTCIMLSACSTTPKNYGGLPPPRDPITLNSTEEADELVMFAMGLLDTEYKFGGKNPEAGLDCSGMVSYTVEQVSGKRLPHNAEQIARNTRPIDRSQLRPGDLVFFNTNGRLYSHMGIYIGDQRFIHAPRTNSFVRIDKIDTGYFAKRLHAIHTLLEKKTQQYSSLEQTELN